MAVRLDYQTNMKDAPLPPLAGLAFAWYKADAATSGRQRVKDWTVSRLRRNRQIVAAPELTHEGEALGCGWPLGNSNHVIEVGIALENAGTRAKHQHMQVRLGKSP